MEEQEINPTLEIQLLAPVLSAQPRIEGKKFFRDGFPPLQGQEGASGIVHWRSYFSSLSFRSLLNMQMLVIPKLPKKC